MRIFDDFTVYFQLNQKIKNGPIQLLNLSLKAVDEIGGNLGFHSLLAEKKLWTFQYRRRKSLTELRNEKQISTNNI